MCPDPNKPRRCTRPMGHTTSSPCRIPAMTEADERVLLLEVERAARACWIVWTRATYEDLGKAFAALDEAREAQRRLDSVSTYIPGVTCARCHAKPSLPGRAHCSDTCFKAALAAQRPSEAPPDPESMRRLFGERAEAVGAALAEIEKRSNEALPTNEPIAGDNATHGTGPTRCKAVHPGEGGRCIYGEGHPIEHHTDGSVHWQRTDKPTSPGLTDAERKTLRYLQDRVDSHRRIAEMAPSHSPDVRATAHIRANECEEIALHFAVEALGRESSPDMRLDYPLPRADVVKMIDARIDALNSARRAAMLETQEEQIDCALEELGGLADEIEKRWPEKQRTDSPISLRKS